MDWWQLSLNSDASHLCSMAYFPLSCRSGEAMGWKRTICSVSRLCKAFFWCDFYILDFGAQLSINQCPRSISASDESSGKVDLLNFNPSEIAENCYKKHFSPIAFYSSHTELYFPLQAILQREVQFWNRNFVSIADYFINFSKNLLKK